MDVACFHSYFVQLHAQLKMQGTTELSKMEILWYVKLGLYQTTSEYKHLIVPIRPVTYKATYVACMKIH